jgi:hypothetical protein
MSSNPVVSPFAAARTAAGSPAEREPRRSPSSVENSSVPSRPNTRIRTTDEPVSTSRSSFEEIDAATAGGRGSLRSASFTSGAIVSSANTSARCSSREMALERARWWRYEAPRNTSTETNASAP